jgi:hypothetical protein
MCRVHYWRSLIFERKISPASPEKHMKIYRGKDQTLTDSKEPNKFRLWKPGELIHLSGTKDKSKRKSTELCLAITEEDVIALCTALLQTNPKLLLEAIAYELEARDRENERLRKGLGSLSSVQRSDVNAALKAEIRRILWPRMSRVSQE